MSCYTQEINGDKYYCLDDHFGHHVYGYIKMTEEEKDSPTPWELLNGIVPGVSSFEGDDKKRRDVLNKLPEPFLISFDPGSKYGDKGVKVSFTRESDGTMIIHKVEELEKKSIYNLEVGDFYFYIDDLSSILKHDITNQLEYEAYKEDSIYGNIFLTIQDADHELGIRKALATIRKWSHDNDGDFKVDVRPEKSYIGYGVSIPHEDPTLYIESEVRCIRHGTQYYSTRKVAVKALKELKSEYKILFNIK